MPRIPKPPHCIDTGCPGAEWVHPVPPLNRTFVKGGFSRGEGHGTNGVTCIGEALGATEDAEGLPFRPTAQAGSLLERAFKRLGYSRDQFRINNLVRCRPPHDHLAGAPYEDEVIHHCRPFLDEELSTFKPRCIVALGGTAARELTGLAGTKQGVSYIRGYPIPCILPSALGVPVIPTFHPSFLRQGKPQYFGVLCHDLQRAVQIARAGVPDKLPRAYQTRPSIDEALAFRNRCALELSRLLTYDIETPSSAEMDEDERDEDRSIEIVQIQFSLAIGEGIVLPIAGAPTEYMDIAKEIMAMEHRKAGHYNHLFDDPRLKARGFNFGGPFPIDTYEMWHHLQPDLPANLQFVGSFEGMDEPWKHLFGSDLPWYGACDVDAPQRILSKLPNQLRKRGLWDGYERLVYQLRPILDRMQDRGIPINDERRQAFGQQLDKAAEEIDAQMQALVPDELKNCTPKNGYKREPKDLTGLVQRVFKDQTDIDGPADPTGVLRWCRLEPFKPSSQQLIRYMKHKGHPVPKKRKTDKDTSEAVELERLSRKTHDPLYKKVIWYREVRLMKATFVDGWAPSSDSRVHTTFKFAPATAQMSSSDPNVMNYPAHEKEGGRDINLTEAFQRIIEAPPGYKIISLDHKSFHAVTQAWLADDEVYDRIARIDVHSFVASEFLRLKRADVMLAYKDDELRDYLKWVKREHRFTRDFKCKRVILGWQFGRGYRSIYEAYMEAFENETESKRLVQTLEGCFPKTVKWRKSIMLKAHYDTYLTSPFGFIRWFWDVHHFGPNGEMRNGDQAEQAIAYLPANVAFGMMREEALAMTTAGYDDRFGLVNNLHDAWKFVCADDLVDECLHTVKPLMEAPCSKLKSRLAPNGLWCAVSVSVGQNDAPKSDDNPDGKEDVTVDDPAPVASLPS
jgi:uracil-DNA glycosylase family 4